MSDPTVWDAIAGELVKLADPVAPLPPSLGRIHTLAAESGWDLDALAGVDLQALADALDAVASVAVTPPDSLGDIGRFLHAIGELIGALRKPPPTATVDLPVGDLALDLVDQIFIRYLQRHHPVAWAVLVLLGLADEAATAPPVDALFDGDVVVRWPIRRARLALDRLGSLFNDPTGFFRSRYLPDGLATGSDADLVAARLFPAIGTLVEALGGDAISGYEPVGTDYDLGAQANLIATRTMALEFTFEIEDILTTLGLALTIDPDDARGQGIVLTPFGEVSVSERFGAWQARARIAGQASAVAFRASDIYLLSPGSGAAGLQLELGIARVAEGTDPAFVIGDAKATRLEARSLGAGVLIALAEPTFDFGFELVFEQLAVVLAAGDGDSFLSRVLPESGIRIAFDGALGWQRSRGIFFKGGPNAQDAAISADLPVNIDLGVVKVPTLRLALTPGSEGAKFGLGLDADVNLGPLAAVIEGVGLRFDVRFVPNGNLGPVDVGLGFQPPKGIGLSIDTGVVHGGGYLFLDPDKGEYAGVLEVAVPVVNLKIIGLLNTKLPDGKPGFSLLLIITVEFSGIQLGFGFTLNGVGGLVGINRKANNRALEDGVRTGTLDSILFPVDPVRNATRIVADLRSVFPPTENRYLFGPMVKVGWGPGPLLEFEVALIIELPAPLKVILIGKLSAELPDKDAPLVVLNLAVAGILDLGEGTISISASIYDSRIAVFSIFGDMAMRVGWKADKRFVLSAGGFHPRFAAPSDLSNLRRLTIGLCDGDNPRVRLESYFAITSNTVQFGAAVDVFAAFDTFVGTFAASARLSVDALVQFDPFRFWFDLYVGIDISWNGDPFVHAALSGRLEGPAPWRIMGEVAFDVLGGKVHVSFEATIGEELAAPVAEVELLPLLREAIGAPDAWSAHPAITGATDVTTRVSGEDDVVVHPLGSLTMRQRVMPLETLIERFGSAVPVARAGGTNQFAIRAVRLGNGAEMAATPVSDDFAAAQFVNMTDDQKLSAPAFESFPSGVTVPTPMYTFPLGSTGAVATVDADAVYDELVVDDPDAVAPDGGATPLCGPARADADPDSGRAAGVVLEPVLAAALVGAGASHRAAIRVHDDPRAGGPDRAVSVVGERFVAVGHDTVPYDPQLAASATTYAQALQTKGRRQLVTATEVTPRLQPRPAPLPPGPEPFPRPPSGPPSRIEPVR